MNLCKDSMSHMHVPCWQESPTVVSLIRDPSLIMGVTPVGVVSWWHKLDFRRW